MSPVSSGCWGRARVIGDELRKAVAARGIRAHVAIASTQTAAIVLAAYASRLDGRSRRATRPPRSRPLRLAFSKKLERRALASNSDVSQTASVGSERGRLQTSTLQAFQTLGRPDAGRAGGAARRPSSFRDSGVLPPRGRRWRAAIDQRPLDSDARRRAVRSGDGARSGPIEELEPLSFVLTRLLEPLCDAARAARSRRRGAARAARSGDEDDASTPAVCELPTPMRDVRTLRTLALLDLESHPPDAADRSRDHRHRSDARPRAAARAVHARASDARAAVDAARAPRARDGRRTASDRRTVVDTYRPGAFGMGAICRRARRAPARLTSLARLRTSDFAVSTYPALTPLPPAGPGTRDGRHRWPSGARYDRSAAVTPAAPWCSARGRGERRATGGYRSLKQSQKSEVRKSEVCRSRSSRMIRDQPGGGIGARLQTSNSRLRVAGIATNGMSRLGDGAVYRVFRDRSTDGVVHRCDCRLNPSRCRPCTGDRFHSCPHSELHAASAFSFLQGASLPEILIDRAVEAGHTTLALLDRDGVYGIPRFHKAATAAGIKPIIGGGVDRRDRLPASDFTFLLAGPVETQAGYRNSAS